MGCQGRMDVSGSKGTYLIIFIDNEWVFVNEKSREVKFTFDKEKLFEIIQEIY